MQIQRHQWTGHTRSCRFSLCLQDGSVFADFDVDEHQRVYLVRISFDGYGCCECPKRMGRMSANDSIAILNMVERQDLAEPLATLLRTYLATNKSVLWEDALRDHDLID